jgi:hypothetical protein
VLDEWILNDMGRSVGSRQCDRNYETRGHKPEQHQDEHLPLPTGKQLFKHRNRTVTMRTFFRDAVIHRQRSEKRKQNKNQSCEGRNSSGGEESDARLVTKGREIIDARQTHDLPPRMLRMAAGVFVRTFDLINLIE